METLKYLWRRLWCLLSGHDDQYIREQDGRRYIQIRCANCGRTVDL